MAYDFVTLTRSLQEGNRKDLEDSAYQQIVTNLLKNNLRGNEKLTDIDSYDSEKIIGQQVIPGCLYAMVYEAKQASIYKLPNGQSLEFSDTTPVVLITSVSGQTIRGVNLNMCTGPVRMCLLDLFYSMDVDFFEKDAERLTLAGKPALSKVITKFFMANDVEAAIQKYMYKQYAIDAYASIFRTYNGAGIKNLRLIEPWQWKYIPFLNYNGTVDKKALNTIYKLTGMDNVVF